LIGVTLLSEKFLVPGSTAYHGNALASKFVKLHVPFSSMNNLSLEIVV
jgi:hypothetical protein